MSQHPGSIAVMTRVIGVRAHVRVPRLPPAPTLRAVVSDAEMKDRLGYAIRAAMAAHVPKLTPPELAKLVKRDPSTVLKWADGESVPNLLMTLPLANALGVKPELLYDPPPVPPYPLAEYVLPSDAEVAHAAAELAALDPMPEEEADPPAEGERPARRRRPGTQARR
jgi:transcriptional regulator with XRE-family HTH domain